MFPFPSLPQQWEKRLVRYLLHRLDLLEERTLGDLSNLEGSLGTNSVFTVKDVGLKVERLRNLVKIPHRFELKEAVVGTLTINLPANLFISGAVEILVKDVKVSMELSPPPDDVSSTPSTPRPGDSQNSLNKDNNSSGEFPATAEDLAQSFLEAQSKAEQQQLMSLYAENPMAASIMSDTSTATDEDEETGYGTSMGLPGVLANLFKGIADRMIVRVRGTIASLESTLPEERGGEKVLLQIEVEDVDIEGVSKNITSATSQTGVNPRREGKRRITLENIRGYITASASMFGLDDSQAESPVFGAASEVTEKGLGSDTPTATIPTSAGTLQNKLSPQPSPKLSPKLSPKPSPKQSPKQSLEASSECLPECLPESPSASFQPTLQNIESPKRHQDPTNETKDLSQSVISERDKYLEYDDSDEEVLAFAPPSLRSFARPGFARTAYQYDGDKDEDEDSEDEDDVDGGASFGHTLPRQHSVRSPSRSVCSPSHSVHSVSQPVRSPSQSIISSSSHSSAMFESSTSGIRGSPSRSGEEPPALQSQPSDFSDDSSGDDEMDQEASRMLSQSTIFSREEADSLYMSATSGLLRSRSELKLHHELDELDGEDEEIDAEEMDQRLDKLINGETISQSPKSSKSPELKRATTPRSQASRKIRKQCLLLDIVTIYYPSLSAGTVAVEKPEPTPEYHGENRSSQQMPGAFSMYASRHSGRFPTQSSPPTAAPVHRSPTKVKIVDAMDARPTAPSLDSILGDHASGKTADIEIIAANIHGTVDIQTEKMLGWVLETVQDAMADEPAEIPQKKKNKTQNDEPGQKKSVQLIAEEIDVKLIHHLHGHYIDTQEEDEGDDRVQLQCQLNDVKIHRKGLPDDASTSKLSIKKFALRDEEEGIITFLPARQAPISNSSVLAAKMSHSFHHRKRSSTSTPSGGLLGYDSGDEDDIVVIFSQSTKKVRVNVQTLPLRIRGDLKRLEETFSAFGGVGSVLASTTASTATITRAGKPPSLHEADLENIVDTKVDARIGGLVFDVVGQTAAINMSASPLKIKFQTGVGVSVGIDKIEISGPSQEKKDARLVVEGCRIEFASKPTQEDLGRLLELLTPSKDRYDDDDILIDTLLRQREQGSVLRMFIAGVRGELIDMTIFDRLKELGDEVIKVLTVTDFVAGDERPGLLTLINIEGVYAYAEVGGGLGKLEAEMDSVGLTHVSAPSLFAVALGTISVRREGDKELLGEGLGRAMFPSADQDRPMIMVRMVGDEPEPVVKIKLWNIRVEYSVDTLMALMQAPAGATGEDLAQEMVQSIIELPPLKEKAGEVTALGFDIVIKDSLIALNPLNLKSRGLVIFTDAQLQAALPIGGNVRAGLRINKANVMLIDNIENLQPPERGQMRGRREVLSEHLTGFVSMGYVPLISTSAAYVTLQVAGKSVELDVKDELLLMESCADSTQTLIAIMNGLKPPTAEGDEIKYCTEVMPIDMLRSLSENEFAPSNRTILDPIDDQEEEFLYRGEDVPTNFTFVDSFYGHKSPPETPQEELADSMLEEDLAQIQTPASLSRQGSGRDSVFREQVTMLDNNPLETIDEHFQVERGHRKGKRALNQDAVDRTIYFPLRVRLQDVNLLWNLHDGYDWQITRDTINNAVRKVESKAAERRNRRVSFDIDDDDESVVDDFLFNSIYIGVSANRDPKELTNDINKAFDDHMSETSYATSTAESSRPLSSRSRSTITDYHHHAHHHSRGGGGGRKLKLNRSRQQKMQFELKGVNVEFLLFPPNAGEVQSSVELRCNTLDIVDNVPTSTWKKFVTYDHDSGERESSSDMVRLEVVVVKPVPELAATELVIKVNILPLRLHVDQDTLDFMTRFFEFQDDSVNMPPPDAPQPDPPFLQRVEVNSVKVKLDYKPKKIDYAGLRSGHTTEFMNFFILEEAEMVLRRVVLHGISGFPRMSKLLNDTWMPDIKNTQLGDVLSGVAPVRSLVNLGKGARDLVVVPVREYRKDGRVIRSLQKGVGGFVRNTTGELVRLGTKMAVGTQAWLQSAEDALGAGAMFVELGDDFDQDANTERMVSLYADQPETITQGVRAAQRSLKRNFAEARNALLAVPSEMAERGDARGAATAIARAAPVAVLRPMVGVTEAVSQTLMGVGNAMEPERRRRRDEKYKKGH